MSQNVPSNFSLGRCYHAQSSQDWGNKLLRQKNIKYLVAGQINIKFNIYVIMILNFEIDLQFGNMQFMILKLKKILIQSPNP